MRAGGGGVHLHAPLVSLGSYGVIGLSRALPGDRWVQLRSLGSLAHILGVFWFIRGSWVYSRTPWGRWFHPGSLGLLAGALMVDGFIRGLWDRSRVIGFLTSAGVV